uniref:SCP domain-containing protein n=1 Tax=Megaselia scalaris TaxID=36166 RepID=T1GBK0_MEGSC
MFLKYLIVLAILFIAASATDYCNPDLCRQGKAHIGCNNNGKLSSSCPANSQFFNMQVLKNQIVRAHNEKRNRVAGGFIPKHSPAFRMATIQWDDELAYLAGLNVKSCKYGHDQCRNTDTFEYSGQNLAKTWWKGMNQNISMLIQDNIEGWFDEYKKSDMSKINKSLTKRNQLLDTSL